MNAQVPAQSLQLHSLITATGKLELSLALVPTPQPGPDEVLVRVDASPINPSDLGLLFSGADLSSAEFSGSKSRPIVTAQLPEQALKAMAKRIGQPTPVGNEGAGVVVATGSSPAAQALKGKSVAAIGGGMYAQYRCVRPEQCLVLPSGATAADGASSFVNPLTALGMVETMRREGHKALVHTAAASNLGQMLVRICAQDHVPLVNIVRKEEQKALLKGLGASFICDSESPTFLQDLTKAMAETGATLGFDAIGGGKLAGQILSCMEAALAQKAKQHSIYGTTTHKQVYIYGGLDLSPTELVRNIGMAWGLGGWLLFPFLEKIGPAATAKLKERVAAELRTTFASHYAKEVSLAEALTPEAISGYGKRATGAKYLVRPNQA